jgi:3-oxoacid CoA-transferase
MDQISSKKSKIICLSPHTHKGKPKIVEDIKGPITGKGVVDKLITEMGVFEFNREGGMTLTEIARGVTVDSIEANTGCKFRIASDLKSMD